MSTQRSAVFIVESAEEEPLIDAVERAITQRPSVLADLSILTNVALGDPYLAEQLATLHRTWAVQPQPSRSLIGRIRTRLAWWLLGSELQQINSTHATLVRLLDSLIVQLDEERAARRRIEEQRAYEPEQP